jgi:alanyl-tRNA synthetase
MITYRELRQKYLDFHASKGHAVIPSSSLLPKEDPTVLFNTAGMQPIIPYLLGLSEHPAGNMLVNSQKCIRTDDILEVGDNRHLTFFEMLGNWSIGAYFKAEIIQWSMEFMTSKNWLGLDPKRIFVTVYKGNNSDVKKDEEAIRLWKDEYQKLGMDSITTVGDDYEFTEKVHRIRTLSGKDNWWGLPYRGPCGPCAEMYYLLNSQPLDFETSILPKLSKDKAIEWVENNIIEIGNNVFMEYIGQWGENKEPMKLEPMKVKNIDTGLGLERFLTVINGYETVYETDLFINTLAIIEKYSLTKV